MKLTIITINLNNATGLERTIKSVVSQTFSNYEYIIIDGESTDGSQEIIKFYDNQISIWVSEKDSGIYNAMNKGIMKSTGEYFLFLNSGDTLIDQSVLMNVVEKDLKEDIISCNLVISDSQDISNSEKIVPPEKITAKNLINGYLPHPSSLIKRRLFEEIGLYNESYKISSDWDFFLKAILINGATYRHINLNLTIYEPQGISSRPEMVKIYESERMLILNQLFPLFAEDYQLLKKLEEQEQAYIKSHEFKSVIALKKSGIFPMIILIKKIQKKMLRIMSQKNAC